MAFENFDFYDVNSELSEEERLVQQSVRDFVEDNVVPVIEGHFRDGTFPKNLIPGLAELGVLGANLEGYGCAGLNNVAYGLIMQELERGDSGVRSFVSVQGALVMYPIYAFGTEEQKQKYLPKLASGEFVGCFGLTEPDFGSNPAGMITRAVKDGNEYVLNGNKMWITNGCISDVAVVWAKLDDEVRGFIVEKGTPGFSTTLQHGKFSLRASVTSELHFEDCRIPAENLLPEVKGLKGPLSCLSQARYGIAWGAIGSMQACFDCARQYSLSRIQFGRPIAGFQLVQRKLAGMATEITKAQLMALRLGRLKDAGKITPQQISMGKMNNVREALKMARLSREVLGANGVTDEYPIGRHMMNLESVYTYEGTDDIHTLIVGHAVTGIPAYE